MIVHIVTTDTSSLWVQRSVLSAEGVDVESLTYV
jgi:hypothetical protein